MLESIYAILSETYIHLLKVQKYDGEIHLRANAERASVLDNDEVTNLVVHITDGSLRTRVSG